MNHAILGFAALALACAPGLNLNGDGAAQPAPRQQGDQWSWHGRLAPGKTLEIRGVNGPITAEAGSGDAVVVTAEKHGRRSDPAEVRIEVIQDSDGVTICAVYPGTRNRCGSDDDYHMSTHDNDVEVRFHAQVPPGVRLVSETVNGDVEATDIAGPVKATTVNGGVRLSTATGDASGSTVNGSVTAALHGQGQGPLRFNTVNGSVTVSLPKQLDADLEAETVNGAIESDYPITVSGRLTPRRLNGRIGQGGRRLKIETVNGSIHIRSVD